MTLDAAIRDFQKAWSELFAAVVRSSSSPIQGVARLMKFTRAPPNPLACTQHTHKGHGPERNSMSTTEDPQPDEAQAPLPGSEEEAPAETEEEPVDPAAAPAEEPAED